MAANDWVFFIEVQPYWLHIAPIQMSVAPSPESSKIPPPTFMKRRPSFNTIIGNTMFALASPLILTVAAVVAFGGATCDCLGGCVCGACQTEDDTGMRANTLSPGQYSQEDCHCSDNICGLTDLNFCEGCTRINASSNFRHWGRNVGSLVSPVPLRAVVEYRESKRLLDRLWGIPRRPVHGVLRLVLSFGAHGGEKQGGSGGAGYGGGRTRGSPGGAARSDGRGAPRGTKVDGIPWISPVIEVQSQPEVSFVASEGEEETPKSRGSVNSRSSADSNSGLIRRRRQEEID